MRVPTLLSSLLFGSAMAQLSVASTSRRGDLSNPDKQNIRLIESERIVEYNKRNYTWPIQNYSPNTPGWKDLMETRFRQVEELEGTGERYEGYIQTIHSAFLVPNFTEHGFGLARCPETLLRDLREGIREGAKNPRFESQVPVIDGPIPWFVDRPDLTDRVLHDLRNYAETWSGVELTPYRAYGFRLYRNESQLWMHVDKMQTHIISFILHIDSSDDAEPWPIFIEDFHGRTHEVILTPGDILFYESSKCFHGRPRKFNGSWYSSIFVHYYPSDGWFDLNHELEAHFAVPPRWAESPTHRTSEKLQMVGTSMMEPNCPDNWCRTQNSIKWSGPGEEGYWIDPQFQKHEFNPVFGDHDEL
ncbi:hypothetical protein FisN_25Lh122 [Fistulifera solaris]|uniref:Fe2OG dioxygenase domain-containing protein n=1 Tax=Fistulifera solaris TaxID=1519565 RepID=A0A1Z5J7U7_FISSO|nr:hypothetical protein FisN_25Lh122 [Fistulifera solaris]|eukprot:GAX10029.1 hypothetical protein FisN_25Lh122 [Fistulifera solaris]